MRCPPPFGVLLEHPCWVDDGPADVCSRAVVADGFGLGQEQYVPVSLRQGFAGGGSPGEVDGTVGWYLHPLGTRSFLEPFGDLEDPEQPGLGGVEDHTDRSAGNVDDQGLCSGR